MYDLQLDVRATVLQQLLCHGAAQTDRLQLHLGPIRGVTYCTGVRRFEEQIDLPGRGWSPRRSLSSEHLHEILISCIHTYIHLFIEIFLHYKHASMPTYIHTYIHTYIPSPAPCPIAFLLGPEVRLPGPAAFDVEPCKKTCRALINIKLVIILFAGYEVLPLFCHGVAPT